MADEPVRWGILGTAAIAPRSFLPALLAAGNGEAYVVGGRDGARATRFAAQNGIASGVEGYDAVIADERVEAIYNPLPNSLHAEWTIKALRAGKPVLCEKPLCVSVEETQQVLDVARETGVLLWEAFVYPFHRQTARLQQLLADGAIGTPQEVQSTFTYVLESRDDIRASFELAGGALNDIGCYCIALARTVFKADPVEALGWAHWAPEGVDEELAGVLLFGDNRRLTLSVSMALADDTSSRILGTNGEIRLTNAWHPGESDSLQITNQDGTRTEASNQKEPSFTDAVRHINRVIRLQEEPLHLAIDEALGNALGVDLLRRSAQSGCREAK